MPQLHIRMATREDAPAIVSLLNATFRTPIDTATWEWYVYGNPLGNSQVYVSSDQDKPDVLVGVIAFAPIHLSLCGKTMLGDYAHHLALMPEYRDTLSYIALLRHSLKAQAARGIEVAIGPPNRTAYPIHKTLMKWRDFGFLDCLRKLSLSPQDHSCSRLDLFPSGFDEFYRCVASELNFCVEKNAEWMNWRFCQRPGSPYTVYACSASGSDDMTGYVILKRWQDPDGYRKAHILDLHAVSEDVLVQLMRAAESYAADCNELNLWAVLQYPYRDTLESLGFVPGFRQPLIARAYNGSTIAYPGGKCSLSYGDGDTLY